MPKIKTLRSASKRFTSTASGQFKYKHAYKRHILTKKSKKYKRKLRQNETISNTHISVIKKFLPYV